MKISFKSKKIEKLLSNEKNLVKEYGSQAAGKIIQRLGELDAAPCIMDLPLAARPHPHDPKSSEIFSVDILKHQHPLRLLFKPLGNYEISDYQSIFAVEVQGVKKIHS